MAEKRGILEEVWSGGVCVGRNTTLKHIDRILECLDKECRFLLIVISGSTASEQGNEES